MTNSRNTIYSIKRFMGRKFDEVQEEINACPTRLCASSGDCEVEVEEGGKTKPLFPTRSFAMILARLKG